MSILNYAIRMSENKCVEFQHVPKSIMEIYTNVEGIIRHKLNWNSDDELNILNYIARRWREPRKHLFMFAICNLITTLLYLIWNNVLIMNKIIMKLCIQSLNVTDKHESQNTPKVQMLTISGLLSGPLKSWIRARITRDQIIKPLKMISSVLSISETKRWDWLWMRYVYIEIRNWI